MKCILYSLHILAAFTTVNKTISNTTDPLKNIFKFDNLRQHCNVLGNYARETKFPLDDVLKLAKLIWDIVIDHPIFKKIIKKDNLTTIFEEKGEILKYDYLNIFSGYFYQNDFWNSDKLTDSEVRFIDKIAWESRSILRTLRFCHGDEIFNAKSTNNTIQRIVHENICFKSKGIDKFPYIFYKRCKHLYSHFEQCLEIDDKVEFLSDIKKNQVGIMGSECINDHYDFKNINMSYHHTYYDLLNFSNTSIFIDLNNATDVSVSNDTNISSHIDTRSFESIVYDYFSSFAINCVLIGINILAFITIIFLVLYMYKRYCKKKTKLPRIYMNVHLTNEEFV
ncbi:putative SP-containing membrane protein [Vairimorpha necatrix]|uniref:SP-containing membrane protein n=1 Tax=Vairimorpha necatrix TaxID=6039 RepID=A0AAX4JDG0_9MICR